MGNGKRKAALGNSITDNEKKPRYFSMFEILYNHLKNKIKPDLTLKQFTTLTE